MFKLVRVFAIKGWMYLSFDQAGRGDLVTGLEGMGHCFVHQTPHCEPCAGAGVHGFDFRIRISLAQPGTQQGLEEMMVSKPGSLVVERDDKEIGAPDGAHEVVTG